MPTPSRWMIRCSLFYLLMGFAIGALMLTAKAYPAYSRFWMLLSVHIEVLIFGFIIQFTMGTAYWILPRFLKGPPRGQARWAKRMVIVFNSGIILNLLTYLNIIEGWGTGAGRMLEVFAAIIFITLHWHRAVSYR